MPSRETLVHTASMQVLFVAPAPKTVAALFAARYGSEAPKVATSLVARSGSGNVTLKDTHGKTLDALSFDAAGSTGRREMNFQFASIEAVTGDLTLEVYA